MNAALNGFYQDIHRQVTEVLAAEVRTSIDQLLVVSETETISRFERLKTDPGKNGVDYFQAEVEKLRAIHALGIGPAVLESLPWKVLQVPKRRAMNETAREMRDHPEMIRYRPTGLLAYSRYRSNGRYYPRRST